MALGLCLRKPSFAACLPVTYTLPKTWMHLKHLPFGKEKPHFDWSNGTLLVCLEPKVMKPH